MWIMVQVCSIDFMKTWSGKARKQMQMLTTRKASHSKHRNVLLLPVKDRQRDMERQRASMGLGLGWGSEKQRREQEGRKKHLCFIHQSAPFLLLGQSNTREREKHTKTSPSFQNAS